MVKFFNKVGVFLYKCVKFPFVFVLGVYEGFFVIPLNIAPLTDETLNLIIFICNRRLKGSYFLGVDVGTSKNEPIKAKRNDCNTGDGVVDE